MSGVAGLVTILVLVVFGTAGVLVMPAHCQSSRRLFDAENAKAAATTTDTNSTSVDGSKVHLIFCLKSQCDEIPPKKGLSVCYCCQETSEPCYNTEAECRANCFSCDPQCQLLQSSGAADSVVMGSRSTNVNATGKLF